MSLASRAVLWTACGLTIATVSYVHYKQWNLQPTCCTEKSLIYCFSKEGIMETRLSAHRQVCHQDPFIILCLLLCWFLLTMLDICIYISSMADKNKLHEGVLRDVEKQQRKKVENLYFLQQQIEMGKMLKSQERKDDAVALKLLEESKKSTS